MNKQEAFKIGFLHKCAEDGLTPEETLQRVRTTRLMVKAAGPVPGLDAASRMGGAAIGAGADATASLAKAILPLLLLGPPVAGGLAGYGLSQATNNPVDKSEMRKKELMAAYERAAAQLQRAQQRRIA